MSWDIYDCFEKVKGKKIIWNWESGYIFSLLI